MLEGEFKQQETAKTGDTNLYLETQGVSYCPMSVAERPDRSKVGEYATHSARGLVCGHMTQ